MKLVLCIILIYVVISLFEWVIHRYVMHGNPGNLKKVPIFGGILSQMARDHLEHHKHVNIDMTLKNNVKTKGVYFPWITTLVFISLIYVFLKCSVPLPIVLVIVSVSIHNLLWNNWHTRFHQYQNKIGVLDGLPKLGIFPLGPIYNYLWKYHAVHHSQKGEKYNFNIILPMFDHIFGTLGTDYCIDNTEYCKSNPRDNRCRQKQKYCFTEKDIKT